MVPKMFIVLTVLLLAYCNASTLPDASEPLSKPQDTEESAPSTSVNVPQCSETAITEAPSKEDLNRITCDLFNSGQLCAAHCILHGNAGGYCDSKKVCVCRKRSNDPIEQSDERAPCGGGCITSSQCEAYSGTRNCRCAWFGCNLYTAEADLTDVEQFDIFIKQYSGNTKMLQSAESAYRTRQ